MGSIPGPGRFHMPQSNYAHAPQLLNLCSGVRDLQLLKPMHPRTHAIREATAIKAHALQLESSLCSPQLEKVCAKATKTQESQK